MFSKDQQILEIAGSVMWLQCLNCFPDGFKSLQKGVIRALGLQYLAVYINFVGHWVLNLSVTYYLVFYLKIGIEGIWISKCLMELFIAISYTCLIKRTDWLKIAEKT